MEKQSNIFADLFKWARKQDEYFKEGIRIEFAEQMLEAINQAETEFSKANWNGEGALPVSRESLDTARRFVTALAEDIVEKPSISALQDGTLSFVFQNKTTTCTLSMEPGNWISYAMTNNRATHHGRFRLKNNTIPKRIIGLIRMAGHK
jgi:hypothetical protein